MRIDVYNGPNLGRIGERSQEHYGITTEAIRRAIDRAAEDLGVEWELYQTNHEGDMIERLHREDTDGVVLNPAGWTHHGAAIRDAVALADYPVVEVHVSNIHGRGEDVEWRGHSIIAPECVGQIAGFGATSYALGVRAVYRELRGRDP